MASQLLVSGCSGSQHMVTNKQDIQGTPTCVDLLRDVMMLE